MGSQFILPAMKSNAQVQPPKFLGVKPDAPATAVCRVALPHRAGLAKAAAVATNTGWQSKRSL